MSKGETLKGHPPVFEQVLNSRLPAVPATALRSQPRKQNPCHDTSNNKSQYCASPPLCRAKFASSSDWPLKSTWQPQTL